MLAIPRWQSALSEFIEYPERLGHLLGFPDLNETHRHWIKLFLFVPPTGQTVLQAHRNSFKTTCGIVAMALLTLIYPNIRILIVRKTEEMASELITALQKVYASEIMLVMARVRYNLDSFQTRTWSQSKLLLACKTTITPEPSFTAVGIGGGITGRHFDYIWPDDIVTIDDRLSISEAEYTKLYVQELSNIVTPTGSRMYTGTPWADADAFSILPEPHRYPIGTVDIPGICENGIINEKWVEDKRKTMTNALWCANYELKHVSDDETIGAFLTTDKFHTEYLVAWVDGSYSNSQKSDKTSVAIVGFVANPATRSDLWDIEFTGKSWQKSITHPDVKRELIEFLAEFQPIETCLESQLGDSTQVFLDSLTDYERILNLGFRNQWTYQHQGKNKHEKIQYYVAGNKSRMKAVHGTDPLWLQAVSRYAKNAKHDDEADSLADGVNLWQTSKYLIQYITLHQQLLKKHG